MVSTIAFIVAFLCLLEATLLKKDFFNPCRVYIFTQSLTLGIAYLKLAPAMTDFHILTWVVFFTGMLCFVMGSYAMKLVFDAKPLSSQSKFSSFENYRWGLHCIFAFILFLLYFLPAKSLMDYAGGFPLFSGRLPEIMSQKITLIVGRLIYSLPLAPLTVVLFAIASFGSVNPHRNLRYFSRLMVALQLLAILLFNPARNTIFISIAVIVILWNYLKKNISSKFLIFGIAILLGAFVAIAQVREQYNSSNMAGSASEKIVLLTYTYISNNFWNLDYALNPQHSLAGHPTTYGIDHFAPVPFLGNLFRSSYGWDDSFNSSISKKKGYNTANYLWEIYKDFGGIGVAIVPFLWGLLITWLYLRLKINLQMRTLLLYSFAITMVGLWWFSIFYKLSPIYVFFVLAIIGITELCQNKMNTKNG